MLVFNSKGYLVPNTNIISDLSELETEFVSNIISDKRISLFANYLQYSKELKSYLDGAALLQWIDGSFVTKKKDPGDIDLVTFIDVEWANNLGTDIDKFKYPSSSDLYGVDAYLVKIYNREHKKYPLYKGDRTYWMDKFDKTYRNRLGQKSPKGFIEIIF